MKRGVFKDYIFKLFRILINYDIPNYRFISKVIFYNDRN